MVVGEGDARLHYIKVSVGSTVGDTVNLVGGIKPGTCIAEDLPSEAMGRKPCTAGDDAKDEVIARRYTRSLRTRRVRLLIRQSAQQQVPTPGRQHSQPQQSWPQHSCSQQLSQPQPSLA